MKKHLILWAGLLPLLFWSCSNSFQSEDFEGDLASVDHVEPLSWWTDMHCPLTLMFHGKDLADAHVRVAKAAQDGQWTATKGIIINGQHNAESPNYLFVDVTVKEAGMYRFLFEKDGKKTLTLTVNRMLTGSTVPEWDTMLYFKDTSSPQEYEPGTSPLVLQRRKDEVQRGNVVYPSSHTE